MGLFCLMLSGCAGGFPKVVIKLGEGDTTAAELLRPFVIASDDGEATAAGAALLRAGGTAGDAAAAMALTLAVTLPSSASLHAAGTCLLHDAGAKTTHVLTFEGPLATARAARTIQGVLGGLPWSAAVAPAATLARFGVAVSPVLADRLTRADVLLGDAQALSVFMSPRRQLLAPGELLRQPVLADTLDRLRAAPRGAVTDLIPMAPAVARPRVGGRTYVAGDAAADADTGGASGLVVGDARGNAVACTFALGAPFGSGAMHDGALRPTDHAVPLPATIVVDAGGAAVQAETGGGAREGANRFVCRLDKTAPQCEAKADAPGGHALTGETGEP